MSRPDFNAAVIDDLRRRVIAHNDACESKVKLGDLKKLYTSGFKGPRPTDRAMQKVDDHLSGLAKAFNGDQPRDKDGKFTAGGGEKKTAADHAARAANAASDAAESAKRAAHHTAAVLGFTDAPLTRGVKGAKKSPLGLPKDSDVHRATQAENAGYSALTSDVIPEFRGELLGSVIKPLLAVAGGATVARALLVDDPKNRARRVVVHMAGFTPALAARIAVGVPLHTVAWAAQAARLHLKIPVSDARLKSFAYTAAEKSGRVVGRAARYGADKAFGITGSGARRIVEVVEGPMPQPLGLGIPDGAHPGMKTADQAARIAGRAFLAIATRRARRFAGVGAVVAIPSYAIDQAISATPLDPVKIGRGYDQFSYRVVRKAASMPETGALAKMVMSDLRKAAAEEAVGEAIKTGIKDALYPRSAQAALSGLGSLAGAATGAITGATGQVVANLLQGGKGNPNHDAKGRFTSRLGAAGNDVGRAALIGAGVGGAIGGGGTYLRLQQANRSVFLTAMKALDEHVAGLVSAAKAPVIDGKHASAEVVDLHNAKIAVLHKIAENRDEFLKEHIGENKKYQDLAGSIEKYGVAHPAYYKEKIDEILTSHIAKLLKSYGVENPNSVARMAPAKISVAIKGLSAEQKTAVFKFVEQREKLPGTVDEKANEYKAAIDAAAADKKEKGVVIGVAQKEQDRAQAVLDAHTEEGPEKIAATAALSDAKKGVSKAAKEYAGAEKALGELRASGPSITDPVGGSPIPTPTEMDLGRIKNEAFQTAKFQAHEAYDKINTAKKADLDKQIGAARDRYVAQIQADHAKKVATAVMLAGRAGVLRRITGESSRRLTIAHGRLAEAHAGFDAADTELSAARGEAALAHDKLRAAGRKALDVRQALKAQEDKAKQRVETAAAIHGKADAKLSDARAIFQRQADIFGKKYAVYRKEMETARSPGRLTQALRSDLVSHVQRGVRAGYDPVAHYALRPTGKRLSAAMSYVQSKTGHLAAGVGSSAKAIGTHAFGTTDANGNFQLQPLKVAAWVGSGAGLATMEYLHAMTGYVQAKATGKKAKLPGDFKVEMQRHPTNDDMLLAVHYADRKNPGQRKVLLGQKTDGSDRVQYINPGARLDDVVQGFKNKGGGGGGGGANLADASGWLGKSAGDINASAKRVRDNGKADTITSGGVSVPVRKNDESDPVIHNHSRTFMSEVRNRFMNGKNMSAAKDYHDALGGLFSQQSVVLKRNQMYQLLTGYDASGNGSGNGILTKNDDWKSSDKADVTSALQGEVDNVMSKKAPNSDAQKDNLRRAVAIVGATRDLNEETLKPIYDKIGGGGGSNRHETRGFSPPEVVSPEDKLPAEGPRGQSSQRTTAAEEAARSIGPSLGLTSEVQKETLNHFLELGGSIVSAKSGRSEVQSMQVVKNAIETMTSDRAAKRGFVAYMMGNPRKFHEAFTRALITELRRQEAAEKDGYTKGNFRLVGPDLDDLEALAKRLPASGDSTQTDGSTPKSPNLSATLDVAARAAKPFAPRAARPLISSAGQAAANAGTSVSAGGPPTYKVGVDSGAAAADLAGTAIGTALAGHVLKAPKLDFNWAKPISSGKAAFSTIASGGPRAAVSQGLRLAGKTVIGGVLGSSLYNAVQGAAGGDSYKRNTTPGENLAMQGGNFVGQLATEGAGEKVGHALTGKIAASAGGKAIGTALTGLAEKTAGTQVGRVLGGVAGVELGPVGTFLGSALGGAVGGALGDAVGHYGYQFFSGYHPAAVQRIMGTKLKLGAQAAPAGPAPHQEELSQGGEIAGGTIGGVFGGVAGEGLGGAIGSVGAIEAARASASASASGQKLQGRPKSQGLGAS
jgi:hypothetical protein